MKDIILRTDKLSYVYGEGTPLRSVAIENADIEIERGELVGIIGHTGSGKSTLIQHFNGLLRPTSGKVFVDGEDVWADKKKLRNVRFKVGVCFQYPEYQLFEETVYKDIAFGPKNMGLDAKEIDSRIKTAMGYVGLDESYLQKSPFDLSGGEKRRVAIAGVMAMCPEVLVLDEPCAGLDPAGRDRLLEMIRAYREKTGSTVLLVSHSMEDIAKLATRVLVLNGSHVYMYGTVEEVFSHGEELKAMGLNLPCVTEIFIKLRNAGVELPNVYNLQQAAELLINKLKGGGRS